MRNPKKKKQKGWLARLVDMDDTSVSASTVFLLLTSGVALLLLTVPAVALLIEVCYNHTIATDLSGMAQYIAAATGIFASGGVLKGWTNYANYRFNKKNSKKQIKDAINELIKEDEETQLDSSTCDDEELDA